MNTIANEHFMAVTSPMKHVYKLCVKNVVIHRARFMFDIVRGTFYTIRLGIPGKWPFIICQRILCNFICESCFIEFIQHRVGTRA